MGVASGTAQKRLKVNSYRMEPAGKGGLDDITIQSRDLRSAPGLPLVVIVRNERNMLAEFLEHYRTLGVKRFFVLDDRSDDGSAEYLADVSDVCLLVSARRYGDTPNRNDLPQALHGKSRLRMVHAWRTGLMNRFVGTGWAVQCDIDEFLMLPEGITIPDLISRLEKQGARGAWGGMIDLYPAAIKDLATYPESHFTHPHQAWFYDGTRQFSLSKTAPPRHHSEGARHRLEVAFLNKPDLNPWACLRLRVLGRHRSPSGMLMKPVLQNWDPAQYYLDSHRTSLSLSSQILLPLLHYRYTPGMVRKLKWAISEGGYAKGNADYQRTDALLEAMRQRNASFIGPNSTRVTDFNGFVKTRNALL